MIASVVVNVSIRRVCPNVISKQSLPHRPQAVDVHKAFGHRGRCTETTMDLIQMLERRNVPGERTVAHEDNSAAIC